MTVSPSPMRRTSLAVASATGAAARGTGGRRLTPVSQADQCHSNTHRVSRVSDRRRGIASSRATCSASCEARSGVNSLGRCDLVHGSRQSAHFLRDTRAPVNRPPGTVRHDVRLREWRTDGSGNVATCLVLASTGHAKLAGSAWAGPASRDYRATVQ